MLFYIGNVHQFLENHCDVRVQEDDIFSISLSTF